MIQAAKLNVKAKRESVYTNYTHIQTNADAGLSREVVPYTDKDPKHGQKDGIHNIAAQDFCAARDCGLVYLIEGDKKYLDTAKNIMLKWATALPEPFVHLESKSEYPYYDANLGLDTAPPMIFYSHAYSLIYDEFSKQERDSIELWLNKVGYKLILWHYAWTASNYYGRQYFNNHLSWHNAGIAYIGFALKDARMVAYAIDDIENPRDFKEMLAGAILMPGDDTHDAHKDNITAGEIYDRYRSHEHKGLGYAMYHGLALCYLAEAAYNNGIDLYAYKAPGGENLFLLYSYYADFISQNDASIKNGLYKGDSVPTHYAGIYELINLRYPGNDQIAAVLKAHGRYINLNGQHGATIGLTHIGRID
jgi:hypothetical protein